MDKQITQKVAGSIKSRLSKTDGFGGWCKGYQETPETEGLFTDYEGGHRTGDFPKSSAGKVLFLSLRSDVANLGLPLRGRSFWNVMASG